MDSEIEKAIHPVVLNLVNDLERVISTIISRKISTALHLLSGGEVPAPHLATPPPVVEKKRNKPGPKAKKPGEKKPAESHPCPECQTPTRARRFSYLCESHRSPELLDKHKKPSKRIQAKPVARKGRKAKQSAGGTVTPLPQAAAEVGLTPVDGADIQYAEASA